MRTINKIILHCSATIEGEDVSVDTIRHWHVNDRGWKDIGYHHVIDIYGIVHDGRQIEVIGAHAQGQNKDSIGICYVGGLDENESPKDTRTVTQKLSMYALIQAYKVKFPRIVVHGHNEFSNKSCPCFNANKEFNSDVFWQVSPIEV